MTRDRGTSTTVDDEGRLGTWAEFDLLELLGNGGFGHVYRARRDGRELALKVPWPPPGRRETKRFLREQQFVADLHHRNIIEIEEVGTRAAGPFIAMELIPDGDLGGRILRDQLGLEVDFVRAMVLQMAAALDYLHARAGRPVHRDVKPKNILLDLGEGDGCRFVLADFGIAKALDDRAATTLTRSGAPQPGTLPYSAPEQLERGSTTIDLRADVYGLGCVVYESLTGRRPYRRTVTADEQLEAIRADRPPPVSSLRPGLAAALDGVIERALSPRREERQATAGTLAAEMEAALRPADPPPARAVPSPQPERVEQRPSPPGAAPRPQPEPAKRRPAPPSPPRRRASTWQRKAAVAAALALASASAALVVVIGGVVAVAAIGAGVSVLVAATPFVRRRDRLLVSTTAEEPVRLACTLLPGWHRNSYRATSRAGHVRLTEVPQSDAVVAAVLAVGCVLPAVTYALVWPRRPAELVLDAQTEGGAVPSRVAISARGIQGLRAAALLRRELDRRGSLPAAGGSPDSPRLQS